MLLRSHNHARRALTAVGKWSTLVTILAVVPLTLIGRHVVSQPWSTEIQEVEALQEGEALAIDGYISGNKHVAAFMIREARLPLPVLRLMSDSQGELLHQSKALELEQNHVGKYSSYRNLHSSTNDSDVEGNRPPPGIDDIEYNAFGQEANTTILVHEMEIEDRESTGDDEHLSQNATLAGNRQLCLTHNTHCDTFLLEEKRRAQHEQHCNTSSKVGEIDVKCKAAVNSLNPNFSNNRTRVAVVSIGSGYRARFYNTQRKTFGAHPNVLGFESFTGDRARECISQRQCPSFPTEVCSEKKRCKEGARYNPAASRPVRHTLRNYRRHQLENIVTSMTRLAQALRT